MFLLSQLVLRSFTPRFNGLLTRVLYYSDKVTIGSLMVADSVPRILVDKHASLKLGNGVVLRSGVEIRAHDSSRVTIDDGVRIDRGVRILAANDAHIHIKEGARIGLYTVMNGGDSISVGEKALVSGFVYLQTSMHSHEKSNIAIRDQGFDHAPVTVGEGAWLGAHVVVMPGTVISDGAVVGSNAVVTSNVGKGEIVGGVPARNIGVRNAK